MKKISEAFFCRPWAVNQSMLNIMNGIVSRHLRGEKLSLEEIEAKIGDGKKSEAGYQVNGGNAIIPIMGVISKRLSLMGKISGGCSTQEVRKNIQAAIDDPNVKQIFLDIDSPGGSVDGTPELADFILAARGKKPIIAYAGGQMCSAAYWIGSAADKVYATRSTEVGSIGVYSVISDYTVMNHNEGIKTEVIKAGAHKATGHPDKAFTAEDRAVVQEEINAYYELFIDAVAKNRGITREAALALADGRVHIGQAALDAGLIDGIDDIDSIISEVGSSIKASRLAVEGTKDVHIEGKAAAVQTSALNQKEEGTDMDLKDLTLEQLRASRADLCNTLIAEGKAAGIAEGKTAGMAESKAAGVAEERDRAGKILEAANKEFKGMGMEDVVEAAVKEGKSIDASIADMRGKRLKDVEAKGNPSPGADMDDPDGAGKSLVAKAEEYQLAHKCTFAEAMSAVSPERKAK